MYNIYIIHDIRSLFKCQTIQFTDPLHSNLRQINTLQLMKTCIYNSKAYFQTSKHLCVNISLNNLHSAPVNSTTYYKIKLIFF